MARAVLTSDRKKGLGESGMPGKMAKPRIATGIVKMPSMMKSHRHPCSVSQTARYAYVLQRDLTRHSTHTFEIRISGRLQVPAHH